jgi:hypothetical protein
VSIKVSLVFETADGETIRHDFDAPEGVTDMRLGLGVGLPRNVGGGGPTPATPAPVLSGPSYDPATGELTFTTTGAFATATLFWAAGTSLGYTTGAQVEAAAGALADGSFGITQASNSGAIDVSALAPGAYDLFAVVKMPDGSFSNVVSDTMTIPADIPIVASIGAARDRRNEGATSVDLAMEAVVAGDLEVVVLGGADNIQLVGPGGWTHVLGVWNSNEGVRMDIYKRLVTGTEGARTLQWTIQDVAWAAAVQQFRDTDAGQTLDIIAQASGTARATTTPSVALTGVDLAGGILYCSSNGRGEGLVGTGNHYGIAESALFDARPDQTSTMWHNNTLIHTLGVASVLHPHNSLPDAASRTAETWRTTSWCLATLAIGVAP